MRRFSALVALLVALFASCITTLPAAAANKQTVCNSSNSATWIAPAFLNPDGSMDTFPSKTISPGQCTTFDNSGGNGRIFIPSSARSYAQGEDGKGYGTRYYHHGVYSNPVNDPVNQINRYKTWA